jgi:hypothetical protein
VWLQTPEGLLGGQQFRCPNHHTFGVLVTQAEVHAKLKSLGHEVGQYHQGVRIRTMEHGGLKGEVEGGYCAGASLDWVRRALLAGKVKYENTENLPVQKQLKQDMRAAAAQVSQGPGRRAAYFDLQYQDYTQLWNKIDQSDLTHEQKEACKARATENYRAAAGQPGMERFWGEFSQKMDAFFAKERAGRGKGPSTKNRGFSNLSVARALDSKLYEGGVAEVINALLTDTEFKPHRAASLAFNPPDGSTGHAVAIHRLNTGGVYHLFDPNFGVYELRQEAVSQAIIYLFVTAYPQYCSPSTSDNHPYQVGGKTRGSYTIFEGSQPPPRAVVQPPPQQPVQIAPPQPVVLRPMTDAPMFRPVVNGTGGTPTGTASTAKKGGGASTTPKTPSTTSTGAKRTVGDLLRRFQGGGQ